MNYKHIHNFKTRFPGVYGYLMSYYNRAKNSQENYSFIVFGIFSALALSDLMSSEEAILLTNYYADWFNREYYKARSKN